MDQFSKLILHKSKIDKLDIKPTNFININDMLNGGFPTGRLTEIYGRSQIGKSSLALSLFPNDTILYVDIARKICNDYLKDNVILCNLNNDELITYILDIIHEDIIVIIDDLTMLGVIRNDSERFNWLMNSFSKIQRELITTKSLIIVLNQIRVSPNNSRAYNPHEGCLDAALKIKMHHAEMLNNGELVYLDVEKHFWGKEGQRCTLIVDKNEVIVPKFYEPKETITEENIL